ncbi:Serine hydrolase-like protein [Oopsacas minuta]|uniref:Serine hydrolase-like protein n=1 Tax=Oopsacas minuta TaxID=111878 RepID=A0AAV7K918_9METZ|nr:Serine hydrolase-like protein [Oopsacas minuta]
MNRSYKEVKIPVSWGTLAGKLWLPNCPQTTKLSGVLMMHGILDNASSFDPLIKYFPQEMTLLSLDLAGHGFSDHYSEKLSYQYFSLLSDVIEVLRFLSWEKPILVGHSLGGVLAINIAAILPDKIGKIIILDGSYPPKIRYELFSAYMSRLYETEIGPNKEKIYSTKLAVVERILEGHPDLSRSSAEILSTRGCREVNGGYILTRDIGIPKILLFYSRYVFWKVLDQFILDNITMPALFTISEESFQFTHQKEIEKAGIKLSPTTRLEYVKGGHQVHMDDPREIGKLITTFLEQKRKSKL